MMSRLEKCPDEQFVIHQRSSARSPPGVKYLDYKEIDTEQSIYYLVHDKSASPDTLHHRIYLSQVPNEHVINDVFPSLNRKSISPFANGISGCEVSIDICRIRGDVLKTVNKTLLESIVARLDLHTSKLNNGGSIVSGQRHLDSEKTFYATISKLKISDKKEYYVQMLKAKYHVGGKVVETLLGITGVALCDDKKQSQVLASSIGVSLVDSKHGKEKYQLFKPLKIKYKKSQHKHCRSNLRKVTVRLHREKTKTRRRFEVLNKEILQEYLSLIMTDLAEKSVLPGIIKDSSHVLQDHLFKFRLPNMRPMPTETAFPMFEYYSRLQSFANWSNNNVSAAALARAGFYLSSNQQRVECFQCGLNLTATDFNDASPLTIHTERCPNCPYLRNGVSNDSNGVSIDTPGSITDTFHSTEQGNNHSYTDTLTQVFPQRSEQNSNVSAANSRNNGVATRDTTIDQIRLPQTSIGESLANDLDRNLSLVSYASNTRSNHLEADQPTDAQGGNTEADNALTAVAQAQASPYKARNQAFVDPQKRRESFNSWNRQGSPQIETLVNAGFYFTGNEDIVRCYHCDIGLAEWNGEDDPWEEHARHSPDCPYLRERKSQQYIDEIQRAWSRVYNPKRPEYNERRNRLATFENSSWPRDYTAQTPAQLSDAGFYYTGEGDTVRCHYCDGGLREWEPNDDPWIEHARWFPFCKYVLKMKGIQFIQQAATGENSRPADSTQQILNLPAAYKAQGKESYVEQCRRQEIENPLKTAAAQSLREMGYRRVAIQMAINRYIEKTGLRDFSATKLLEIIFELEESDQLPLDGPLNGLPNGEADDGQEFELSVDALKKENQHLMQKMTCMVCETSQRCMVFIPCGHRLTCESCGEKQRTCIHCNRKVDRVVKTFLC